VKRYVESNADGDGLTLAELRHFMKNVDAMDFPDATRIRVKAKFGNARGAKLNEISIDNRDRIEEPRE
jgi:hypothetical protein